MANRTWTGRVVLKGEKRGINSTFASADKAMGSIASRLKSMAGFAAFAAAGVVIAGTAKKIAEFEKSISALSAITGATGKDLDRLTEASKRIGATTTLSASQAAEAFKLMASAKPDLLDNLDALERTTEASVTLAEAAGLELPEATKALGEALNQFGAGADQAGKFIDVLAEGARLGSSEIDSTSEALRNAGTVAKLAGLSFAETNAAIQGLAASGVKGSDAGTKLRATLIKLQTQANDEFNPAVVGINAALENLAEANLSVTEKTEIFGERQIATADILMAQRDVVKKLSGELENSLGAAQGQASTRTDNLAGDIKRLTSVFEAIQINLGNKMLPTLRGVIKAFTNVLQVVDRLTASEGINKANEDFALLEFTLNSLFVTGVAIKNIFDIIGEVFKGVGRIIGAVMAGSLEGVLEEVDRFGEGLNQQVDDVARAAFETFNKSGAEEIRKANALMAPAAEQLLTEIIVEPMRRAVLTAGEEAAVAAAEAARKLKEKEELAKAESLERLRLKFRTEREIIAEEWALNVEQLAELQEAGILTEEIISQRRIELAIETAKKIANIEKKNLTNLQKFSLMTATNKTKHVLAEGIRLTQGVAQQSKTMFRINKVAAIANAVVNTAQGVTKALSDYSPPVSFVMAALQAAAGLAQINAIKSATFSGGGTGTTPSAAGSSAVINSAPVGGQGAAPLDVPGIGGPGTTGPAQNININVDGLPSAGPVPAEMVRELIEGINEQLGDGVTLEVSAGSGSGG